MPSLKKRSLSLFLRNNCQRQFILSLYTATERADNGLPESQNVRAALGLVGRAGYEWQNEKVSELSAVFGTANVHINQAATNAAPGPMPLLTTLPTTQENQFIVEGSYQGDTETFRTQFGIGTLTDYFGNNVNIGEARPDIIQILPSVVNESFGYSTGERNLYRTAVLPNGTLSELNETDNRLRLRVIDVKLSSEPGAHYFAEVVYYSITLAAWIAENGFSDRFVVIGAPAIWAGSHDASNLANQIEEWRRAGHTPSPAELCIALEDDLDLATFEVFSQRLRRVLTEQLPEMLGTAWQDLNWHVDHKCKGCEFLGYPWQNRDGVRTDRPEHCMPTAERLGHLSRVTGLSRGVSRYLGSANVTDTVTLANTAHNSPIFDEHQHLRAKRTVFPSRANSLQTNASSIISDSGSDALMPRFPSLHIYVFADFDLSSAITAAIGLRAYWRAPVPYGNTLLTPLTQNDWQITPPHLETDVYLVDRRDPNRERAEFLNFLRRLRQILGEVERLDAADTQAGRRDNGTKFSTYQIYLWDEAQRRHLIRLMGRHLPYILADRDLKGLAWLFPPPELLQTAEEATRKSPITIVSEVVNNTVAVPIPHYYRLIDVANNFRPDGSNAQSLHPLYSEPMSDLIPAERIHEWWTRLGDWNQTQRFIRETNQKKIYSLYLVTRRLETDLRNVLSSSLSAPRIPATPRSISKVSLQSRLWIEYSKLNSALDSLEIDTIRSMPLHEREAKGKAALLTRRLIGQEEQNALAVLSDSVGRIITSANNLWVYEIAPSSIEVDVRPTDFTLAISPANFIGFLDRAPYPFVRDTTLSATGKYLRGTIDSTGLTQVTVEAIDRVNRLIALTINSDLPQFENVSQIPIDFSQNVVLDRTHRDYLTNKVILTLQGIGNPASAAPDPRVQLALGNITSRARPSSETPASEIFWQSSQLSTQNTAFDANLVRPNLSAYFDGRSSSLDDSQWRALEASLSRRLSLIWGPPGTGKSRTLRAIVLAALIDANRRSQNLRILITAATNTALDNVVDDLAEELTSLFPTNAPALLRVKGESNNQPPQNAVAGLTVLELNNRSPSTEVRNLVQNLDNNLNTTIVGCLPQRLHNLSLAGLGQNPPSSSTVKEWFDLIILDEASQMAVAESSLVFSKLASNGTCILAGDNLQLPPIQSAEPPTELEYMVGSIFDYFRQYQEITPSALDINYRSNTEIVDLVRTAGYSPALHSNSPNLRLSFIQNLPTEAPPNFPHQLHWSPELLRFLEPDNPVICYVYDDDTSSQINDFETDTVASLIWLLQSNLAGRLIGERRSDGTLSRATDQPYQEDEFWSKAVGVVTPHRAQMAKIIARLQEIFPGQNMDSIRRAVDTVERFQGQQRDVIIASFGIGDADIISSEDDFLFNLNRFNVLSSRSRAKLIVFVTQSLLEHLSNDSDVLKDSRLLKSFAETFCGNSSRMQLSFIKNGVTHTRNGVFRYH